MIRHPNLMDRGLMSGSIKPVLRHILAMFSVKNYFRYHLACTSLWLAPGKRRTLQWRGHRVHFSDKASLLSNLGEIFVDKVYDFGTAVQRPTIIDCGGNIGLACLYWKLRYGEFDCLCFEPDPGIGKLLRRNFAEWGLSGQIIEAALSGKDGTSGFAVTGSDDGHLVAQGKEASGTVKTCRLSPYLEKPVDLLKLDIEGAELEVLREISTSLNGVRRIIIECHLYNGSLGSLAEISSLLEGAGFKLAFRPGVPSRSLWYAKTGYLSGMQQTLNLYGLRKDLD